jgi:tetratricopeptide (TPR) repeat protein
MRTALTVLAALLLVAAPSFAAEIDDVLGQARAAEAAFKPQEALKLYLQAEKLRPDDPVILQKVARQYSDSTEQLDDRNQKKAYAEKALAYSKRAVELAPNNPVNVLSVAISYGKMALFSGTREKIEYSRGIKEQAEKALELDPNYAWAHHVLGRWNYEVAALGSGKKFVVNLFFGGLPEGTYAEAVKHLERSIELDPDNLIHHLELGFALWKSGDRDRAREQFRVGLAMPETTINDAPAKKRARAALAESAS